MPPENPPAPPHNKKRLVLIGLTTVVVFICAAAGYFFYRATHPPAHPPTVLNPQEALNNGDLDGALEQLDQVLAIDADNVRALTQKSLVLAQKGSLSFQESTYGSQAVAAANQAIALDGKSSEAYRALGYANEIQQKYAEAHAAYEKSIQLNPENALAIYGDAHAYDLQGNLVKAEAGYKAALAIDSTLYSAYLGIGRAENANGNADASMVAFKQVYNYGTNQHEKSEAAYSIGMLLLAQGSTQVDLARGYFDKAISFDATYPSAYLGMGTALYMQAGTNATISADIRGKLILSSISALQKAIELNPNQSLAYMQLAQALFVLEKNDEALSALDSAKQALSHDITLSATEKTATLAAIADLSAQISKKTP